MPTIWRELRMSLNNFAGGKLRHLLINTQETCKADPGSADRAFA